MSRQEPIVLLIQARDTEEMERQEQVCFLERCGIAEPSLIAVNVVKAPLGAELLDRCDALMVGGAGEYSACKDYPWTDPLLDLVRRAADRGAPTFGSCWGHQVIARALGGRVVHDKALAELGCGEVELTDAGVADPLFASFPRRFKANMGHHDWVEVLPPGAVELACNSSQGHQAYRIQGTAIYGTQFHSELDAARERERLVAYRHVYRAAMESEEEFDEMLARVEETPEVDGLLRAFLDLYA